MRKILFPLYLKEDEEEYLFYQQAFVREGFEFAKAEKEALLLRADAVLLFGNQRIVQDREKNSLLETALTRDIPIILIHADRMEQLKEHSGVMDAAKISFADLKKQIEERQQDIYAKEPEEPKSSRFFSILCFVIVAVLAGLLFWKAASFTLPDDTSEQAPASIVNEQTKAAVARVYAIGSMNEEAWRGCGFVVDENGYIVTNAHVVDHAAVKYFAVYRENRYEAEVIAVDDKEDIALIHIHTPTRYKLKIAEKTPSQGDPLYAAGYPGDQKFTVLEGSAAGRSITFDSGITYTPIHMALRSGISGSPVLNASGEVSGIASAVSLEDENLSYMVPCEAVQEFLKDHLFVHQ